MAGVQDQLDETARYIAEPVSAHLERVVQNLVGLTKSSGLSDDAMVAHAVVSGGKKIRPMVTLLAGELRPGAEERLITMATAVELLHIATLIHDDTVDKADTRRGRATVSSVWGNDVAVLLGDYVFAASATFVCDTENIRVIRRFSETIMELAQGELAERFSTHDWAQSIDDYKQRIYDKTASLICTSAEAGGVLSGAPEEETQALRSFGYNVGMAFQIVDDVLDFTSNEEELGKPAGNDLMQGTLTLPALLYAKSHPMQATVQKVLAGSRRRADLKALVELVRNSTAIEESLDVVDGYRDAARASLATFSDVRARKSLEALIDYVAERRS